MTNSWIDVKRTIKSGNSSQKLLFFSPKVFTWFLRAVCEPYVLHLRGWPLSKQVFMARAHPKHWQARTASPLGATARRTRTSRSWPSLSTSTLPHREYKQRAKCTEGAVSKESRQSAHVPMMVERRSWRERRSMSMKLLMRTRYIEHAIARKRHMAIDEHDRGSTGGSRLQAALIIYEESVVFWLGYARGVHRGHRHLSISRFNDIKTFGCGQGNRQVEDDEREMEGRRKQIRGRMW